MDGRAQNRRTAAWPRPSARGPARSCRIAALLLGAVLTALVTSTVSASEPVHWLHVERGSLRLELVESAELGAVESREVSAPMEWRSDLQIIRLVAEGRIVAPGDTLVQFDAGFLYDELASANAELEQHRAELQRIEAEQHSRRLGLKNKERSSQYAAEQARLRIEELGFESETRRQEAQLQMQSAEVQLRTAHAKLKAQATLDSLERARAELDIAQAARRVALEKDQINRMTLLAPIGGLVVYAETGGSERRKLREGDQVSAGQTVISIPDIHRMEAIFGIHEVDRERIRLGQTIQLRLTAFPERTYTGRITDIARLARPVRRESSVKHFLVHAEIDLPDERMRPGMSAQAIIELSNSDERLLIPRAAIFEREGKPVVFPRSTWPEPRPVELETGNALWWTTRSSLEEGEELADRPPADLSGIVALGRAAYSVGTRSGGEEKTQ